MEQNLPVVAKKFWKIVRVLYFMLRKGISKAKLIADLKYYTMMKRRKIAGKAAIYNLMVHQHQHQHQHQHHPAASNGTVPLDEYEFSCTNSPASPSTFHHPFQLNRKNNLPSDEELVAAALEMVSSKAKAKAKAASPALPGFGGTPMVRQLRITDSPFPLRDFEEDNHVDEAAEKFIMKFYKDLKRQSTMAS